MRLRKYLIKGDSQERKPNHILTYFICYTSTESSGLVQPSASIPLLHQHEAAVAGKARKTPVRRGEPECIGTVLALSCHTSPHQQMAWSSNIQEQGNCNRRGRFFLELVNFSLNQPAGNKASFCSLLRASARRRPGNTYSQAELERTQPLTLRILWQRSVPVSSYFYDTKRQQIWQLKLSSLRLHLLESEPLQVPFTYPRYKQYSALLACTDKRL